MMIDLTEEEEDDRKQPAKKSVINVDEIDSDDEIVVFDSGPRFAPEHDEVEVVAAPGTILQYAVASSHAIDNNNNNNNDSDYQLALKLASKDGSSQLLPSTRKRRRKGSEFSCMICLEDELPSFQGYSIDKCNHRFCIDCLTGLIESSMKSELSSTLLDTVICPHNKCKTILTQNDIQYILRENPKLWKGYSERANLSVLESEVTNKRSHTRRCPSERCNYIFVYETTELSAEGRQFDCPACREQFCLQCGANNGNVGPVHTGLSCYDRGEQLKQQKEERQKFQLWQKENSQADTRFNELMKKESKAGQTKNCPKCATPITKNGGCPHMHCTVCKTHFIWGGKNREPALMPGL